MTDLSEMKPSAEERLVRAHSRAGGYSEAITTAFRDGVLAERERIVAMLRDGDQQIIEACIAAIGAHDSATESAIDIARALADRIATEERG